MSNKENFREGSKDAMEKPGAGAWIKIIAVLQFIAYGMQCQQVDELFKLWEMKSWKAI